MRPPFFVGAGVWLDETRARGHLRASLPKRAWMNLTVPAEWAPHRAMWLGFPSHAALWEDDLAPAQTEVAELARALAGPGGEKVRLMTGSPRGETDARALLGDVAQIEIVRGAFGDI